jgi:DNA-binding transcriptional ArsR family regulator
VRHAAAEASRRSNTSPDTRRPARAMVPVLRSEIPTRVQVAVSASQEPLLEQHLRLLEASAIHQDLIRERGYFSASASKTLQQLGFSKSQQQRIPALVVPICGVTGDVVFHQVRPDQPRELAGKPVKYETPHGARMALDIHPLARHRLGNPSDALIVTEGIRKADAAFSQGVTAVALMGVWNWRGTNGDGGKAALADWELVALNGRKVFLAFDSDASTKREVRAALERLQRFLELRGAVVHAAELEAGQGGAKVGLDDFLAAGGDLAELLNKAQQKRQSSLISIAPPIAPEAGGKENSPPGDDLLAPVSLQSLLENIPPEPAWSWRGYVAPFALTLLAGRPKVGKSTFVFALLARLVAGEPFLGLETAPTGVLLLSEERRDTLAEKARILGLNSFPPPPSPSGGKETKGVDVVMRGDTVIAWPELVRQAMTHCHQHDLSVLLIDTWDRWTSLRGDSENAAGAVNEALEPLQYAAASGLAVVIVSHQRKSVGEFGEAVRGSNALTGGVDIVAELERARPSLSLSSRARALRAVSRFTSTPEELFVELDDEQGVFTLIEHPEEVKAAVERERILEAVTALDEATADKVAEEVDLPHATVRRHLGVLRDNGHVVRDGKGKRGDPFRWRARGDEEAA